MERKMTEITLKEINYNKPFNECETVAYELLKKIGWQPQRISNITCKGSPDFICSNNRWVEVKKEHQGNNGSINMGFKQWITAEILEGQYFILILSNDLTKYHFFEVKPVSLMDEFFDQKVIKYHEEK